MISVACGCEKARKVPESAIGKRFRCPKCSTAIQITAAETLEDGAGDFDASLTVLAGPTLIGMKFLLGGVVDIEIGKQTARHILLAGQSVSRAHARLVRVDFDPSRWTIRDDNSTHGLFVNGEKVTEQELQDGDILTIGEYDLRYDMAPLEVSLSPQPVAAGTTFPPELLAAAQARSTQAVSESSASTLGAMSFTGPAPSNCPSCERPLPSDARVCVDCGINVRNGRPILTTQGVDEDSLYESASQLLRIISLLVWVTPMPIPIRSEAFGTRKPYTIWLIALLTIVASIAFYVAQRGDDPGGSNLMLWPSANSTAAIQVAPAEIDELVRDLTPDDRKDLRQQFDPHGKLSDRDLVEKAMRLYTLMAIEESSGEFHAYQLITHALLHDTSSIFGFVMHLAGNMLFLLVFGTRVNSLIGNVATAVVYPVLAVCAAAIHLWSLGDNPSGPMLGASGAIMGLAGMYLVLFPAHRVYCAMWVSLFVGFRRLYGCKIFRMRGFWLLLIYFSYDILMNAVAGDSDGVAHWAHMGGFITGVVLGLAVLFSRQFNARGGDLLSVTLGKNAWPLIGKPSRWNSQGVVVALPADV